MTLIVSLRIPDGIVIAGDSLSTMTKQGQLKTTIGVTCPECDHRHDIQQRLPMPHVPATTFSYAQKVFPFFWQIRYWDIWNWPNWKQIYLFRDAFNRTRVNGKQHII